jgi:hypothetical protein
MTIQYFRGTGGAVIAVEDGMGSESEHDEFYDKWLFDKEIADVENSGSSVHGDGDFVDDSDSYHGE